MIGAHQLCANCLEPGASAFAVGSEKGNQRDPYRETLSLCPACQNALSGGNLAVFSRRFQETRTVSREEFARERTTA